MYLDLLSQDDKVDFRSFGGPGAGAFLEAPVVREDETPTFVPNAHFIVALRDRLMLPVCPPGSTCHRRNKDGVICGKPLDPRGKHCKQCEIGPARIGRHDSLRDFSAGYHRRTTGLAVSTEQRVVAWDRVNPRTGDLEEARLDYYPGRNHGSAHLCRRYGYLRFQRLRAVSAGPCAQRWTGCGERGSGEA